MTTQRHTCATGVKGAPADVHTRVLSATMADSDTEAG